MPSSSRNVERMYERERTESPGVSSAGRCKKASPVSRHVEKGLQDVETVFRHVEKVTEYIESSEDEMKPAASSLKSTKRKEQFGVSFLKEKQRKLLSSNNPFRKQHSKKVVPIEAMPSSPQKVERMHESESSESAVVSQVARRKKASPVKTIPSVPRHGEKGFQDVETDFRHVEKGTKDIEISEDDESLGLPQDVSVPEKSGVSPVGRRKKASPVKAIPSVPQHGEKGFQDVETDSRHVEKVTKDIEISEDDESLGLPEGVSVPEKSEILKEQVEESENQIVESSQDKTLEIQSKPVLPSDDESKKKTDSPREESPDV